MNSGNRSLVTAPGAVRIVVSGGTVSIVIARVAGNASATPPLIARTENVYSPFAVAVYCCGDVQGA